MPRPRSGGGENLARAVLAKILGMLRREFGFGHVAESLIEALLA
jgi:hypothetical protein